MARVHRLAAILTILASLYALLFFAILPVPFVEHAIVEKVLPTIPWWALVSFGSYSLWSMGWGLWSVRDCPDAYNELLEEISLAKNDLRTKGVTVD
ncbi:dolichol-phosphate mannosyltransferase subunit 3, partial [Athelia psychrophila]